MKGRGTETRMVMSLVDELWMVEMVGVPKSPEGAISGAKLMKKHSLNVVFRRE